MGYQLIAVSADRTEKLQQSIGKHQLKYELVSDSQMAGAKAFGLAYRVDDKTLERYKGFGIDLEEASGEGHHLLPVPAVFLIGTDGIIDFQYVNPDHRVRLDPDLLLAAAKASLKKKGPGL
ncbi:redoxin domain-containing protein [Acidobacteria bacterium AH-259-A15]|nr:redoxin domain-containing protein [Acidobacteria bacterium AH-259-A15]